MLIAVRPDGDSVQAQGSFPSRSRRIPPEAWPVLALTLVAAALRFSTLGAQSFWFDEAQAAHEVSGSLGSLFSAIGAQETSPPLYFVLGWIWAKVFGAGTVGLRSLSALLGTALIPLLYGCGRELVSRRAGLIAALLGALSPFMIWYSQEAREYMLLTTLCAGSLLFFARARRTPTPVNLSGWAACSALALLSHFFAGFLIAPEALLLVVWQRRSATWVAVAVVAAVEAALVPLALSEASHPLNWVTSFALSARIQQVPVAFGLSQLYQSQLVNLGLLAAGILTAAVVLLLLAGAEGPRLRGALTAAGLAAFVLLAPLLAAALGHDYYVPRVLMPAWVPLAVLLGAAATVPRVRRGGAVMALALVALFVYGDIRLATEPQYQRADWRSVARALGPAPAPRLVVAEDGSLASDPLALYLPRADWRAPSGTVSVRELDVVGSPLQTLASKLPARVRLVAHRPVGGFELWRFASAAGWQGTTQGLAAQAAAYLQPASGAPAGVFQRAAA